MVLEKAYDLTIAKFFNLPKLTEASGGATGHPKSDGTDCRHYFRACLREIRKRIASESTADRLRCEWLAARSLQGLVVRHFHLSLLECRRGSGNRVSSYLWAVNGSTLCLWMPSGMTTAQRRRWLEANVPDPDPGRPGELERIQALIYQHLMHRRIVPLDERLLHSVCLDHRATSSRDERPCAIGKLVADEKGANIARQRPAIQAMGPQRLTAMILLIFEDLAAGRYEDRRIASSFGLSRSTFSRFAGSRWSELRGRNAQIPDLWRNTAQVIAGSPAFVETARAAGVWTAVEAVLSEAAGRIGG